MFATTPGALEIRTAADCLACKTVVKLVIKELKNNRLEERIIESRYYMPTSLKFEAGMQHIRQNYASELIHILVVEEDPELARTLLSVCET